MKKLKILFWHFRQRKCLRKWGREFCLFLIGATLTACSSGRYSISGSYHGKVQCVPFARAESGIALKGNAAQWWYQARGHYQRSTRPIVGSVIVLKATRKMPYGHVSVVKKIVSVRRILVDQANWLPGRIEYDVPIEDVSRAHDWSIVRVWWAPIAHFGKRTYPIYGFILPRETW